MLKNKAFFAQYYVKLTIKKVAIFATPLQVCYLQGFTVLKKTKKSAKRLDMGGQNVVYLQCNNNNK